jgi:putative SOS response-associated peptidase YedK
MCGRFVQSNPEGLHRWLKHLLGDLYTCEEIDGTDSRWAGLKPRFNLAPSQDALVFCMADSQVVPMMMKWGLIPIWADQPNTGNHPINARSETADSKPAFRESVRHRRCVIPADGFYEWEKVGKDKQPFFVHPADGSPMLFAGIWNEWKPPTNGPSIFSFAILTTEAHGNLKELYDRMPVLLTGSTTRLWLDSDITSPTSLMPIYSMMTYGELQVVPVSSRVNDIRNDDAECLRKPTRPARTGSLFD